MLPLFSRKFQAFYFLDLDILGYNFFLELKLKTIFENFYAFSEISQKNGP